METEYLTCGGAFILGLFLFAEMRGWRWEPGVLLVMGLVASIISEDLTGIWAILCVPALLYMILKPKKRKIKSPPPADESGLSA